MRGLLSALVIYSPKIAAAIPPRLPIQRVQWLRYLQKPSNYLRSIFSDHTANMMPSFLDYITFVPPARLHELKGSR